MICVSFMVDETEQNLIHLLAICISFPFTLLFVLRTLFSYQIVHHFLIDYELFVNQHQSAPFLLCVLQIFFCPFCSLLFDCIFFFFFFLPRRSSTFSSSHIFPSIYLWFLGLPVVLELSLSLSAGRSALLSDSVTGSIPVLTLQHPYAGMLPWEDSATAAPWPALLWEVSCLHFHGELRDASALLLPWHPAPFKELCILYVP